MACRKANVATVCLHNGVKFIGGKLVSRVAHGNQQIQWISQSLKLSHDVCCSFVDLFT